MIHRYTDTMIQRYIDTKRENRSYFDTNYKMYCIILIILYTLYLISYVLFISLVERIQLFSRAVCPVGVER